MIFIIIIIIINKDNINNDNNNKNDSNTGWHIKVDMCRVHIEYNFYSIK